MYSKERKRVGANFAVREPKDRQLHETLTAAQSRRGQQAEQDCKCVQLHVVDREREQPRGEQHTEIQMEHREVSHNKPRPSVRTEDDKNNSLPSLAASTCTLFFGEASPDSLPPRISSSRPRIQFEDDDNDAFYLQPPTRLVQWSDYDASYRQPAVCPPDRAPPTRQNPFPLPRSSAALHHRQQQLHPLVPRVPPPRTRPPYPSTVHPPPKNPRFVNGVFQLPQPPTS